jgi:hypothetical protein
MVAFVIFIIVNDGYLIEVKFNVNVGTDDVKLIIELGDAKD